MNTAGTELFQLQCLYSIRIRYDTNGNKPQSRRRYPRKRLRCAISNQQVGAVQEIVVELVKNKVVLAAGMSTAIGQLSKPFTRTLLYGKDLDFMSALQAGGFPSTHSSSVVAAATSLALERGFSDSIFGMSLVYAGLVMYDSQGVRREVGNHAKILNKKLSITQLNSTLYTNTDDIDSVDSLNSTTASTSTSNQAMAANTVANSNNTPLLLSKTREANDQLFASSSFEQVRDGSSGLLKESIGHTEIEVVAGAFLGFLVSLAVHALT